jgi:hypothetical protein
MNAQQIRDAIEATHSHIGFSRFALDMKNLSADQSQALLSMPEIGGKCRVRLQPMAKSSAYGQMWEFAAVAGYMQTADEIQALVVFLERENGDTNAYDWAFVSLKQIKGYRPERVRELRI